jgi:hypothetical protein
VNPEPPKGLAYTTISTTLSGMNERHVPSVRPVGLLALDSEAMSLVHDQQVLRQKYLTVLLYAGRETEKQHRFVRVYALSMGANAAKSGGSSPSSIDCAKARGSSSGFSI